LSKIVLAASAPKPKLYQPPAREADLPMAAEPPVGYQPSTEDK